MYDYELKQCVLCRVVCHDLDNCVSTVISRSHRGSSRGAAWTLCSGSGDWQLIQERRPSVMSVSHSRMPTRPHDSSLCGECGWLPSCDYSLTHLSQTPSHPSSATPSFHVNHRADLGDECLSPRNLAYSSLPCHDLSECVAIANITLALDYYTDMPYSRVT